jgi:uncharacterized repeat protein (TIGR03803 family)
VVGAIVAVFASCLGLHATAWAQTYRVLKSFESLGCPSSALTRDAKGNLYGTMACGGDSNSGAIARLAPDGRITVVHHFTGSDGSNPEGDLLRDGAGNLYGTTYEGGASNSGTIYKVTHEGTYSLLHSFAPDSDGSSPVGGLIKDHFGNLYGTAYSHGSLGAGTVFKLAPDATFTVLHSFGTVDGTGYAPSCCLVSDASGNLFGTTQSGGASGSGTVFRLAPDGTHVVLYSFSGGNDGAQPFGLAWGRAGVLYGLTSVGGSDGAGTLFKLAVDGAFSLVHTFTGGAEYPGGGLARDGHGNLYGVATRSVSGPGAVFRVATDGTFTVLYSFTGGNDGSDPRTRPVLDAAGNVYGTATGGGGGYGTIFKLAPDGNLTYFMASDPPPRMVASLSIRGGTSLERPRREAQTEGPSSS